MICKFHSESACYVSSMAVLRSALLPHSKKVVGANSPWFSPDIAASFEETQRTDIQAETFRIYTGRGSRLSTAVNFTQVLIHPLVWMTVNLHLHKAED